MSAEISDVTQPTRRAVVRGGAAVGLITAMAPTVAIAAGNRLRWGSSSIGSTGYVIMEAMVNVTNAHTDMKNSVQATAGSAENFALLGTDELEIIHTTSMDWFAAGRGDAPYKQPIVANQLFGYVQWLTPPIVYASSDIMEIGDLKGRNFSPSKSGSGGAAIYRILFEEAGIAADVNWRYGSWSEVYNSFQVGQMDAVVGVLTNGKHFGLITQAEAVGKLRALEIPLKVLEASSARNPGILYAQVTPEQWHILERPTWMPMLGGVLGAHTAVSAEAGYEITKAVIGNAEAVRKFGAQLSGVSLENGVNGLMRGFPVNAGAAQYFKEKGVWRDDLTIAS